MYTSCILAWRGRRSTNYTPAGPAGWWRHDCPTAGSGTARCSTLGSEPAGTSPARPSAPGTPPADVVEATENISTKPIRTISIMIDIAVDKLRTLRTATGKSTSCENADRRGSVASGALEGLVQHLKDAFVGQLAGEAARSAAHQVPQVHLQCATRRTGRHRHTLRNIVAATAASSGGRCEHSRLGKWLRHTERSLH